MRLAGTVASPSNTDVSSLPVAPTRNTSAAIEIETTGFEIDVVRNEGGMSPEVNSELPNMVSSPATSRSGNVAVSPTAGTPSLSDGVIAKVTPSPPTDAVPVSAALKLVPFFVNCAATSMSIEVFGTVKVSMVPPTRMIDGVTVSPRFCDTYRSGPNTTGVANTCGTVTSQLAPAPLTCTFSVAWL